MRATEVRVSNQVHCRRAFAGAALLWLAGPIAHANGEQDAARCVDIADDTARLRCYDRALKPAAPADSGFRS